MKTYPVNKTYLQMILSVRSMRLVIPLLSFLLIWRATHTGVSGRARLRGVSPSLFMMSMSAPLDRNNLKMKERKKHIIIHRECTRCKKYAEFGKSH